MIGLAQVAKLFFGNLRFRQNETDMIGLAQVAKLFFGTIYQKDTPDNRLGLHSTPTDHCMHIKHTIAILL